MKLPWKKRAAALDDRSGGQEALAQLPRNLHTFPKRLYGKEVRLISSKGATGRVYLYEAKSGRQVAVKVFEPCPRALSREAYLEGITAEYVVQSKACGADGNAGSSGMGGWGRSSGLSGYVRGNVGSDGRVWANRNAEGGESGDSSSGGASLDRDRPPAYLPASPHTSQSGSLFVAHVFDLFTLSSQAYLVEEYIPYSLQAIVKRYKFTLPLALRLCYFRQLVQAVRFLQSECGISHRDIKPANCCVTASGSLKLIDFGSSITTRSALGLAGSPSYAAPEVYRGRRYDSYQADCWSLGVVLVLLYYCSACCWSQARDNDPAFRDFCGERVIENVVKVMGNAGRSDEIDRVILALLDLDPSQRMTPDEVLDQSHIPDHSGHPSHISLHEKYLPHS